MERCTSVHLTALEALFARYSLRIELIPPETSIPGSFWGDSEAGIIGNRVNVRADTPVHSALHEACHTICMDNERRHRVHTDAGGDFAEENGVCYLQIVLSDFLPSIGKAKMFSDMDAWGYSFRLGSTQAWFERDAEDARAWLVNHGLLTVGNVPTWKLRV